MRFLLFLFLVGIFWVSPVKASEPGGGPVEEKQTTDTSLDQMRKYMIEDQKSQQDIYRLKGEIEKTKLELDKQKMLRELANLTGSETAAPGTQMGTGTKVAAVIKNIFYSDKIKEAVLDVGGRDVVVKEGAAFQGAVVKRIESQAVVFAREDKEERLEMRK